MGGGAIIVDGKGDKDIYTDVYNTCVHCNREDDFYVMNFNVPRESNTMNPLLSGDTDEIIDVIGNMLETGGDNAFWAGRALSMMKGLLSLLVPLRDREMLYVPFSSTSPKDCKIVPIFTFKFLNKFLVSSIESEDVGSSIIITFALEHNAFAISTCCFSEMDIS